MTNKSNNTPVYGGRIATHVPGHEASISDTISNLIRVYANNDLYNLHNLSADIVIGVSDNINSVSISNIPRQNYRHIYEVVQTSGRSVNNRWFVKNQGFSVSELASIPSPTVQGHYDYVIPNHIEYGKSKHIIVERFSAPGSSYTMPLGMLDVEAEEFSSYNSLNFRKVIEM